MKLGEGGPLRELPGKQILVEHITDNDSASAGLASETMDHGDVLGVRVQPLVYFFYHFQQMFLLNHQRKNEAVRIKRDEKEKRRSGERRAGRRGKVHKPISIVKVKAHTRGGG